MEVAGPAPEATDRNGGTGSRAAAGRDDPSALARAGRDEQSPDLRTRAGTEAARMAHADALNEWLSTHDPETGQPVSDSPPDGPRGTRNGAAPPREGLAQDLLDAIAAKPGSTSKQLRTAVRGCNQHVLSELKRLQGAGAIRRIEDPGNRRHVGYHLAATP